MSERPPSSVPRPILAFLAWRLLSLVLAIGGLSLVSFHEQWHQATFSWPPGAALGPTTFFRTWDAAFYLAIAEQGYASEPWNGNAFYPLWPALLRWTRPLFGGSTLAAAMVLTQLLAVCAGVGFWALLKRRFGAEVAAWGLAALALYPGALFTAVPYSESLFLALSVGLLWTLGAPASSEAGPERRQLLALFGCAFLLPMTRAPGIFATLPIAWVVWGWRERLRGPSERILALLCVAAPVLGFLAVLAWMERATGNAFAGFEAQEFFIARSSILDVFDPVGFLRVFFRPGPPLRWHHPRVSLLDRAAIVGFALSLPFIWKLDRRWFLWALPLGVVPAVTVETMAFGRYLLVVLPFFAALGLGLARLPRWLGGLLLAACGGLQVWGLILHMNHWWVG